MAGYTFDVLSDSFARIRDEALIDGFFVDPNSPSFDMICGDDVLHYRLSAFSATRG